MDTTVYTPPAPSRFRLWFWLAGIVLFFVFLSLIKSILLPFVVGILSAYFLDPMVARLSRRKGWSRTLAAAVITVGTFIAVAVACVILAPLISHQLMALMHDLPDYLHNLQAQYSRQAEYYVRKFAPGQEEAIHDAIGNFSTTFVGWAGKLATNVVQSGLALLNLLSLIFITPVVAFYLLRDWDQLVANVDALLPRDNAPVIREQMAAIDRTLSGFIRGQTNVCLIMATYLGVSLSLVGLKFGLLIGIVTGLFLFLPFVGIISGFTLSLIVALFQFGAGIQLLAIVGVFALGLAGENSFLTPRLVGGKVGLHPLWIIFGMLAGGALFGFVGILISVPLTAVIGVLVRFALSRYLKSTLYLGTPQIITHTTLLVGSES